MSLDVSFAWQHHICTCIFQHRYKIWKHKSLCEHVLYSLEETWPLPLPKPCSCGEGSSVALPHGDSPAVKAFVEFLTVQSSDNSCRIVWLLRLMGRCCRLAAECQTCHLKILYVYVPGFYLTKGVVSVSLWELVLERLSEPLRVSRSERIVSERLSEVKVKCRTSFHDSLQDYVAFHGCPFAHQSVERIACILEVLDYLALRRRLKA